MYMYRRSETPQATGNLFNWPSDTERQTAFIYCPECGSAALPGTNLPGYCEATRLSTQAAQGAPEGLDQASAFDGCWER